MTEAEITEVLFRRDPLSRSDLALVFGNCDRHVSATRARHAAFLFLHGHTPRLLLSGGGTGDDGRSEAEHMAAVAQACGVPPEAVLLESQSRTTAENLSFAVSLLARQALLGTLRGSISSRVPGTCFAFFTSQASRSDQASAFSLHPRKKAAPDRPGHHRVSVGSASSPSSDSSDRFCAARERA
jgi:hypothetical protein